MPAGFYSCIAGKFATDASSNILAHSPSFSPPPWSDPRPAKCLYYFAPRVAKYWDKRVGMSVCPPTRLKDHTSKLVAIWEKCGKEWREGVGYWRQRCCWCWREEQSVTSWGISYIDHDKTSTRCHGNLLHLRLAQRRSACRDSDADVSSELRRPLHRSPVPSSPSVLLRFVLVTRLDS